MTVSRIEDARLKRKHHNDLFVAMDTLLDQLRAVCMIPAENGLDAAPMTAKQRANIIRLNQKYHNALMAGAPKSYTSKLKT